MEPEILPDAQDLWWSWVVLAALHRATGDDACRFHADRQLVALDSQDGSWLRMQRTHASRTVLWGRSTLAPEAAPDARRDAPDWALSEATEEPRPSFFAWHAHGEWDSAALSVDEGGPQLLRPMLTVDPRLVELARRGRLTPARLADHAAGPHLDEAAELVRLAQRTSPRTSLGQVRTRLRNQIHGQMRDTVETDRMLMQRPPCLVQWSRINGPGIPFEYAVMALRDRMVPARTNTSLPGPVVTTLTNVLTELHRDEASEDSGAWLFARVTSDGVVIRFDRAFDSWPAWFQVSHADDGPSLDDLAWEMDQRAARWKPAWSTLLLPR